MKVKAFHFLAYFCQVNLSMSNKKGRDSLPVLVEAVRRYTDTHKGSGPFTTEIKGLTIVRSDHKKRPAYRIFKPALCIVVQGTKWATFGKRRLDYKAGQALVVSVEMPLFGTVAAASPERPYLGIVIEFDLAVMQEVRDGLDMQMNSSDADREIGAFVTDLTGPLTDCVLRSVRLLETPEAIPILYPGIMREMCYWLLTGPDGGRVIRTAMANGHEQRIISAIYKLRERFAKPVRIEELAELARMSPSTFHRQFKAITSMTPLQYQKQLRLLEARRLMISNDATVEAAAFQVGYESPSHFNREYTRMFGTSPRRDISALRLPVS
jgi:AraC-like DNA-binding protein